MAWQRCSAALVAIAALSGCALADDLTGPFTDGDMSAAPYSACAYSPARPKQLPGGGAAPQCLRLLVDGRPADLAAGPVRVGAGQSLLALPTAAPGCAGDVSHFVLAGSSPGAGAFEVAIGDSYGRPPRRQRLRWRGAVAGRRWRVGGIGTALHNPSSVTLRVEEGEVLAESACLAGYHR
ncbi:MAG TPA: hypothetical protein VF702_09655 [Allosphingosinicella sp.]|jgi:hypothetical protein